LQLAFMRVISRSALDMRRSRPLSDLFRTWEFLAARLGCLVFLLEALLAFTVSSLVSTLLWRLCAFLTTCSSRAIRLVILLQPRNLLSTTAQSAEMLPPTVPPVFER
jgi:hypothetical protein